MTLDQILSRAPDLAEFLCEFADCFGRSEQLMQSCLSRIKRERFLGKEATPIRSTKLAFPADEAHSLSHNQSQSAHAPVYLSTGQEIS